MSTPRDPKAPHAHPTKPSASDWRRLAGMALKRSRRRPTTATPRGGVAFEFWKDTRQSSNLGITAGLDTACWSYDQLKRKHQVRIGDEFALNVNTLPKRSAAPGNMDRHLGRFADALLRHEYCHARDTDKNLARIATECRNQSVPFMLFNIFEDARIEANDRKRTSETFDWTDWLQLPPSYDPLDGFLHCISSEGERGAMGFVGSAAHRKALVRFYERACNLADSYAVIALCREWLDYWRSESKPVVCPVRIHTAAGPCDLIGKDTDGSAGTPVGTAEGEGTPGEGPTPDELRETTAKSVVPDDVKSLGQGSDLARKTPLAIGEPAEYYAPADPSLPIDRQEVARIAARLERIIVASASMHTARATSSGSRLHMPGIVAQSATAFRSPGKMGGKPRAVFVFDMSSSMGGDWTRHGRKFFHAVRELIARGTIDGRLFLTGDSSYAEVTAGTNATTVHQLRPNCGCESVRSTLNKLRPVIEFAHVTVVYTDARLTDGSVDAMMWRQRGVDILGACVIPDAYTDKERSDMQDEMRRHFGSYATATTGEGLATKLAGIVGERAKRKA